MVQMNRFAGQKLRHICREQTYGHQGEKVARGGGCVMMYWEIGFDMYTVMCIKWMTNKNLLYKKINKIKFKKEKKYGDHRCMGLSLGFLSCSIDLYFCICASIILS